MPCSAAPGAQLWSGTAADRAEAEPAGARVLEHWEAQVEAEEALRLLAELRPHAR